MTLQTTKKSQRRVAGILFAITVPITVILPTLPLDPWWKWPVFGVVLAIELGLIGWLGALARDSSGSVTRGKDKKS